MVVKAAVLAAAFLLGACGAADAAPRTTLVPPVQSTPQPTPTYAVNRASLEFLITQSTNQNFRNTNAVGSVSATTCVQDGVDGLHFVCNLLVVGNRYVTGITVKATCDVTGNCVWRPE